MHPAHSVCRRKQRHAECAGYVASPIGIAGRRTHVLRDLPNLLLCPLHDPCQSLAGTGQDREDVVAVSLVVVLLCVSCAAARWYRSDSGSSVVEILTPQRFVRNIGRRRPRRIPPNAGTPPPVVARLPVAIRGGPCRPAARPERRPRPPTRIWRGVLPHRSSLEKGATRHRRLSPLATVRLRRLTGKAVLDCPFRIP